MRAPALLVFALAVFAPRSALSADTLGVLAVAAPPGPTPELVEATTQLRQAVAERHAGVLEARQLRERMSGQAPGASLTELDRAYEGARAAAVAGDYEGSVRTLRAIIADLEKLPDGEESFRQWTRAMLRLAKAESDLGHADEAHALLERLVRSDPDVQVDSRLYPPKLSRQVDEARAQLRALPARRLTVTAPARDVRVFVNGRAVGSAPVTVSLARGRYRISGARGVLRAPPVQVDLLDEPQTSVTLDFSLAEALRPGLGPGLALPEADRARRIVGVAGFLSLDSVLATSLGGEGGASYLIASLYDARRGMLKREGRVRLSHLALPPGATGALAEFLVSGETRSSLVEEKRGARPIDLAPPAGGTASVDLRPAGTRAAAGPSKTLGWVAFGGGIAAVALAGVATWQGLSAKSSYDSASKLLGPGGTLAAADTASYRGHLSDGDGARNTALVAGVGAGVAVATAGVLAYLAYRQTGEVGPFRF